MESQQATQFLLNKNLNIEALDACMTNISKL